MKGMKFLGGLLALAFLGLLGWGGYKLFQYLSLQMGQLDRQGSAIVILVAVVLLVCAFWVGAAIRNSVQKLGRGHLAERGAVYKSFVELWFTRKKKTTSPEARPIEGGTNSPEGMPDASRPPATTSDRGEDWDQLQRQMALWGSDGVIKRFTALLRLAREKGVSDSETARQAESLVLEMRKDLGASNQGWNRREWRQLLNPDGGG